jgi:pyrimidine operon attenuation protein / uracil phosphoribosyltransferase
MSSACPDAEELYSTLLSSVRRSVGRHRDGGSLAIIGIQTGGVWIAERLHRDLGLPAALGSLSSAFHRDDYGERGIPTTIRATEIGFPVDDRHIILVDDILFTGRTIRAALNEIFDYGRPRRVELAVLVDRGGRELPLQPDHVGGTLALGATDKFVLSLETSGRLALRIERG